MVAVINPLEDAVGLCEFASGRGAACVLGTESHILLSDGYVVR